MKNVWNAIRSVMGVVTGILIFLIAIVATFAFEAFARFLMNALGLNPSDLAWMRIFGYPGGKILFPALGVFIIFWAIALALKKSWARIVGIALCILAISALIAMAILIIPFWSTPLVMRLRWLILILWLVLLSLAIYQAYLLAFDRETEQSFATQYIGRQVVATCDRCQSKLDAQGRCPKCEAPAPQAAQAGPGQAQQAKPAAQPKAETPTPVQQPKPKAETPTPAPPPKPKAAPAVLARLVGEGGAYDIRKERTTIGREADCDIVLADTTVSKHHAAIVYAQGQFSVEDTGSTNGTIVNGTKIDKSRLESGAQVEFGRAKLVFEIVTPS